MKVGKKWKHLYRAVDSAGFTVEFMLSAKRDVSAAKRFFEKLMRADHRRLPCKIGTDKHASYPEAFAASMKEKVLPSDCKLRRVRYLNNVIEKDHRAIRRRRIGGRDAARQAKSIESLLGVAAWLWLYPRPSSP